MKKLRKKKKGDAERGDGKEMSLSGHLRELRNRLLLCAAMFFAAVLLGVRLAPEIVRRLLDIGRAYQYEFVYLSPQELLLQYFGMALIFGICLTLPLILYEVWVFLKPALKKSENVYFLLAMVFGFLFFCVGVYFAYWLMLPFMLEFLIGLSSGSGVEAVISVQSYLSFIMTIFLIFGIVFELPVVSVLLTQLGFLKVKWMKSGRKVVVVLIFVIAAIITPPDVVSQIMVVIPMLVLYEFSILLCGIFQKFSKSKVEGEGAL